MPRPLLIGALLGSLLLWAGAGVAGEAVISIILDDMGYRLKDGQRAVNLPGNLTYAFLPQSPYATRLAEQAHQNSKEVMLHLPMQADAGNKLGPGGLTDDMSEQKFKQTLHSTLASIPHVKGFNNHMGSHLTRNTLQMRWLMEAAMFHADMYFVDSRTTAQSVAQDEAIRIGIENTRRDIFLDYQQKSEIVEQQLQQLIKRAKRRGTALAIGHPYPETLAVLESWLPRLRAMGIRLVHVSELIAIRQKQGDPLWRMSSSR